MMLSSSMDVTLRDTVAEVFYLTRTRTLVLGKIVKKGVSNEYALINDH
jgi:hypothetical protein